MKAKEFSGLSVTGRRNLVSNLHSASMKIVLAVTGGGAACISDLLTVPGASQTVLEVVVPYSSSALKELLGKSSNQSVSLETAREMASVCRERAQILDPGNIQVAGVACTAALTTNRSRRGDNQAWVVVSTHEANYEFHLELDKDVDRRVDEDRIVSDVLLKSIGIAMECY
ncbi:MAG: CinA family protein [Actinomycetota bacterium]|nr:CinA family protein [Actinomycetota bacterium]MDG1488868.1 CinA family protein [Actinomycetota bacterium]